VDRLLENGRRVFDLKKRERIYREIHAKIFNDIPYIFLYYPEALPVVHKRFKNVEAAPAGIGWNFLADYQQARLITFLHPQTDPLGDGYNVTQAMIAVGSGQWFDRGLGFGSQSQLKFLPESQTDFIFAVIAEELGFVGVLFILIAFGLIFFRLIKAHVFQMRPTHQSSFQSPSPSDQLPTAKHYF